MADVEDLRRLSLALPGAHEVTHKGDAWFNVGKKTFALRSKDRFIFKLDREHQRFLFDVRPDAFQPCKVGTGGVWSYVVLEDLDDAELADLALEAWSMIVPKNVSRGYFSSRTPSRA